MPKPEWALRLVPLLFRKALEAFSRSSEEDRLVEVTELSHLENQVTIFKINRNTCRNTQQKRVDTRTCFVCNRTGHIATDCPLNRSSQNTSRENNKQGKFDLLCYSVYD
jgi:hypothetical protein